MLNLDEPKTEQRIALFNSGFRVFFLAAGYFAVISMLIWLLAYSLNVELISHGFLPQVWHAHEMIYGYTMAVISGFLLTAVTNWTSRKTLTGISLQVIFIFWLFARVSPFVPVPHNIEWMFLFDTLFFIMLIAGISRPVFQTRKWEQLPIVMVVVALMITNSLFYLAHLGILSGGTRIGLYGGFFLILTLVLIMARRVIPFFIERGVESRFVPKNYKWLDRAVIPVFIIYAILEIVQVSQLALNVIAAVLFFLNIIRLFSWYTNAIWEKSLVWVLLTAYFFMTLAFGLKAINYFFIISDLIILHSFAVGGIGMLTIGMMSRVALGHTGRNVFEPPAELLWIFVFMLLAVVFRVVFPVVFIESYLQWVLLSQLFWVVAFGLFSVVYSKMLIQPRVDGRAG